MLSHRHGDHTTGLAHVLSVNPSVPVWVPRELYGIFGSSLPGTFYPRCPTLPIERRYYDGFPPELIRHGTPWVADFRHVAEPTEIAPQVHVHSVLTAPEEIERLALALRNEWGVRRIAPGHCTGEPGFEALQRHFGDAYSYAGLGCRVAI